MGLLAKTGLLFALAASNAQADIVPTIEEVGPHHGNSFQIDVPCAEQAIEDFLGVNRSEVNSKPGLITASKADKTVIVKLDEHVGSDMAHVRWVDVSNKNSQSHITLGLEQSYISASSHNEAETDLEPIKSDAKELENHLRTCGRHPLMS